MRALAASFFVMFLYGAFTAQLGAGLISLAMFGLVLFAEAKFKQQEQKYKNDPRHACSEQPTTSMMDKHECECSRIDF